MKIIVFRPSTASDYELENLADLFATRPLFQVTVCEDRIVYVFDEV